MTGPPTPGREGRVARASRLRGSLRLPADKSIAHRALLFSAMGTGSATVELVRPGADVRSTAAVLATLGALEDLEAGAADGGAADAAAGGPPRTAEARRYRVTGGGTPGAAMLPGDGDETLDCGNSGTTMRLLSGALAGRPGRATLVGDASLSRRPMERVAGPLRAMGATLTTTEGHAPLVVEGRRPLLALSHHLPVASAQVQGAVTLAALAAAGTTVVEVPGPTRDHTERMLDWLGAPVRRDGRTTTIAGPAGFAARDLAVPGDISSAAAWLVAGALHADATIRLVGVGLNPSRLGVVEVLREMGADIEILPAPDGSGPEPSGDLVVHGGRRLSPISIGGERVADLIDELPLLSIAMAGADGMSELRDAGELRVKESDRITLVVRNLAACGAEVEELHDGWRIHPGTPLPAHIETEGDHRIAISFAIAALTGVAGSVTIDDPACASVSYAGFWDDLAALANDDLAGDDVADPATGVGPPGRTPGASA